MNELVRILVGEDEETMRDLLAKLLTHAGYEVVTASDGEDALEKFYQTAFELVILDWMMPKRDGLTVAKQMKHERPIKVLMLTAKNLPADEVAVLVAGVDDYLAKPFHAEVLLVRVQKLLGLIQGDDQRLVFYPAELNVRLDGTPLSLTKKEYELLYYFYQNQQRVLTREQLVLAVWGMEAETDARTVDSFIRRLRDKVGTAFIQTVYGTGYRFEIPKK